SVGSGDVFILKLDPLGNFAWARSVGGINSDISASVIPDTSGNIYVSGLFRGTCDFDPSAATYNLTSTDFNGDQFVLKLGSEGGFEWAVQFMLTACGENFNLALDPAGEPYLAGNFKDSADFDPGAGTHMLYGTVPATADMFVLKLDSLGIFQWAVQVAGNDHVYADAITIGSDYSIFTYGYYSGTPDFDPGAGTAYITAGTPLSLFVHKLHQQSLNGVSENSLQNTVSVYPNPGNGIFQLSSENPQAKITTVEIYNATGQKVFSCSPGSSTYTLDLQTQPAGIYFLRMLIEGKSVQKKLVKE
ncbi:MAG TPA: T9SS type A sorting domain-containing protein, partial [Bacteroidia bacterium]|nr:T9SS type A sorting domain-containing protein [Bacteroidia bacterium]